MAQAARLFLLSHKAMALFWREMNKNIKKMEISLLMTFLLTHCSLRTIGKKGMEAQVGQGGVERRGGITMLTKCWMVRLGCGLLDSFNQQQEQV